MKKLLRLSTVLVLFLSTVGILNIFTSNRVQALSDEPIQTVQNLIENINNNEWANIPDLWSTDRKETISGFLEEPSNAENHDGIYNILNARLDNWKEIPSEFKESFPFVQDNSLLYYVAIDLNVNKEDEFYLNGINYFLVELVQEGDSWKISQFANAPLEIISSLNIGFNTLDEEDMETINDLRLEGEIVNRNFDLISTNSMDIYELNSQRGPTPLSPQEVQNRLGPESIVDDTANEHIPPSDIKVYITGNVPANSIYGCTKCRKVIGFDYYIKNVLPNEWEIYWQPAALRAGALCVKMYGWYGVKHPLASLVNANIYDDEKSQVYAFDSAKISTTEAINDTNGIGVQRKVDKKLFLTEYRRGVAGTAGTAGSGKVSQNGTEYLAIQGKNPSQILGYYYNGSAVVGGSSRTIEFFTY